MSSYKKLIVLFAVCLVAAQQTQSAPTAESETSTTPMTPSADNKETTSGSGAVTTETASMAVSSAQDQLRQMNTSFTCYGRPIGYYADIDSACKLYHFCMLGDFNGEQVYQRISYLCLGNTIFDQQALDCVDHAKMTSPCAESAKHYEESNAVLRQAIIRKPEAEHSAAPESTPSAPASDSTSAKPASESLDTSTTTTSTTTTAPDVSSTTTVKSE